ncbi:MAG TPA: hybrid sensor histidine kinase/response regulator [Candidatus Tectomicrobia bacterium]
MLQQPTMLIIEDDLGDVDLLRGLLVNAPPPGFTLVHADRLATGLARLAVGDIDVVLLDLSLPDSHGMGTLHALQAQRPDVPVVILTGYDDDARAIQAVQAGAQDYLAKGSLDCHGLVRALRYAMERHHLQSLVERMRQQDLARKDAFLSHVSHELRSPLSAIYQFVTIVLDGLAGELRPEQHEYLEIVLRNVNQLRTMIDDLLEVARADTGKLTVTPRRLSLTTVVADVLKALRMTAATKGVTLSVDLPSNMPRVYADPERVRQVLTNLIENGLKFTPAQGTVTVRAQECNDNPDFLCISVQDTGCGIEAKDLEKIFERLYQVATSIDASRHGLGLGLYICKELVVRHGGRIWAESQYGHGAIFYFTLPIFSLTRLLVPILTRDNLPQIVLITVEIRPRAKRPLTGTDDAALHEVWRLLGCCILPDRDVRLPRLARTKWSETFFVVTCANLLGAATLVQHLQGQFASCPVLQKACLEPIVSWAQVERSSLASDTPFAQLVEDIVRSVEDTVDTTLSQRRDEYE